MQGKNPSEGQVVVLMRHAEAAAATEGGSDFERTLTAQGEREAAAVAGQLAEAGWAPSFAICSAAWRTRQTFSIVSRTWGGAVEVEYRDDLYLAEPESIARAIWAASGVDQGVGQAAARGVLVIGHNPGIELLASQLAAKSLAMPPATAVIFAYEQTQLNSVGSDADAGDSATVYTLRMISRVVPGEPVGS